MNFTNCLPFSLKKELGSSVSKLFSQRAVFCGMEHIIFKLGTFSLIAQWKKTPMVLHTPQRRKLRPWKGVKGYRDIDIIFKAIWDTFVEFQCTFRDMMIQKLSEMWRILGISASFFLRI